MCKGLSIQIYGTYSQFIEFAMNMESMVPRPPLCRRLPSLDPVTRRQSLLVAALHSRESVTKLFERFLLVQPKGKYDKRYLESLHFSHSTILATDRKWASAGASGIYLLFHSVPILWNTSQPTEWHHYWQVLISSSSLHFRNLNI